MTKYLVCKNKVRPVDFVIRVIFHSTHRATNKPVIIADIASIEQNSTYPTTNLPKKNLYDKYKLLYDNDFQKPRNNLKTNDSH